MCRYHLTLWLFSASLCLAIAWTEQMLGKVTGSLLALLAIIGKVQFMQFKFKSCVHSLTKRRFSISLSFVFSTLSPLPPLCPGSCSEMLSLKLLLIWFWKLLLSLHILGQLKSLQMYVFVSVRQGRSCAHLNFTYLEEFIIRLQERCKSQGFPEFREQNAVPARHRAEGKREIPWENSCILVEQNPEGNSNESSTQTCF